MAKLQGRTAIVTGGAKGIGRHYSQALAAEGAQVMIADIADGAELAAEIAATHGRNSTDSMTFDVRRTDADKLLSFGLGAHFCLGAQFARREIRTMLGKLAQQLDHIEPAGDASWAEAHFVSGVKHPPIAYRFR